ncbi:nitrogen regulation protein NR(II) [Planctomycetota bacterium]
MIILTALLHFTSGVMNPFVLFYVFHVIIATIILSRNLAFSVGISAIFLYGLLAMGEMNEWSWLRHFPIRLTNSGELATNPAYVLWAFVAFVGMVALAQYLTRTVITRMRAKELEAARNHDVLVAVINAMTEGLIFLTFEGTIAICNRSAKSWMNDQSNNKENIYPEDFNSTLAEHFKQILARKDEGPTNTEVIKFGSIEEGQSYIEAKSCSVIDKDNRRLGHVIVGDDLTEHKRLEKDLRGRTEEVTKINEMMRRSQIEMAQREKMVAIGQMASGIAHEIGNPLNSLSSVVQYLGRKFTDPSSKKQFGIIEKQVKRISNILKHMLSLARPNKDNIIWVNVNEVIEETLILVRYDKRAWALDLKYIPDNKLPHVRLVRQNLEQVLLNVCINALDAMHVGQSDQSHILQVSSELRNSRMEIRVSDTGLGMDEEVRR